MEGRISKYFPPAEDLAVEIAGMVGGGGATVGVQMGRLATTTDLASTLVAGHAFILLAILCGVGRALLDVVFAYAVLHLLFAIGVGLGLRLVGVVAEQGLIFVHVCGVTRGMVESMVQG